MRVFRKVSLKIKLLFLLVALTSAMLSIYAVLALRDFKADKIAYVFDTNLAHSKSIAVQIRSELDFSLDQVQFLLRGFNYTLGQFHSFTRENFLPADPLVGSLATYVWDDGLGDYKQSDFLKQDSLTDVSVDKLNSDYELVMKDALEAKLALRSFDIKKGYWLFAIRFENVETNKPVVVAALIKRGNFLEAFSGAQLQDSYLINHSGDVILSPDKPLYQTSESDLRNAVEQTISKLAAPAVVHEFIPEDKKSWLVSAARVNAGDLKIISIVPTSAALEAARKLVVKSALFLVFLICFTVFVSVLSSNRLTEALKKLFDATRQISKGDFDVQVRVSTQDEIGVVADGFNHMTKEIKRLMAETAEKARMESELHTASLVQSTLFPESDLENEKIEIKGYYQPASECGGDWWYYSQIGDLTYFWIGDATGHGVSAALVTSAARSAMGVLEHFPEIPLSQVMSMMNRSIYGATRGQVLMTFFVGCFNRRTGVFSYSNASHDPPYLFRKMDRPLKKRDLEVLMENRGARFGESWDSTYEVSTVQLGQGDRIVFYTDGVTELNNSNGEMWGEREFLKCLLTAFNQDSGIDLAMSDLAKEITEYRQEAALKDDITYFMCHFKESA